MRRNSDWPMSASSAFMVVLSVDTAMPRSSAASARLADRQAVTK